MLDTRYWILVANRGESSRIQKPASSWSKDHTVLKYKTAFERKNTMTYRHIIFEAKGNIVSITFNRPKALNALNMALIKEFSHALDAIASDGDASVLVLTGAGDKAFVSGADINELAILNSLQAKQFSATGHEALFQLQELRIPVIAAVNGFALGGGCEIALACDFIYAAKTAKFGLPEITLGIIPGFGGTQRLPRLIGKNLAKELIYTGRMIPAEEAGHLGIVNKVCPPESLIDEVMNTASLIATRGKVSLQAAKQAINRGLDVDLASGCKIEADAFSHCMASIDAKEGTRAFLEKRKPGFKGSYTQ
jgi:enoyl-CoA hydratase